MFSERQLSLSLDALVKRTETLVGLYVESKSRAEVAEKEVTSLKETVRDQQKQIRQLEKAKAAKPPIVDKSINFSKIVSDKLADTADAAEIRQKLDEYIGHIDQCIAQLSALS